MAAHPSTPARTPPPPPRLNDEDDNDGPPPLESPTFLAPVLCPICRHRVPKANYMLHSVRCPGPSSSSLEPTSSSSSNASSHSSRESLGPEQPPQLPPPSLRSPANRDVIVIVSDSDDDDVDVRWRPAPPRSVGSNGLGLLAAAAAPEMADIPDYHQEDGVRPPDQYVSEQLSDPRLDFWVSLMSLPPGVALALVPTFTREQLDSVPGLVSMLVQGLRLNKIPPGLAGALQLRLMQLGCLVPPAQAGPWNQAPVATVLRNGQGGAGDDDDSDSDILIDESRSTVPIPARRPVSQYQPVLQQLRPPPQPQPVQPQPPRPPPPPPQLAQQPPRIHTLDDIQAAQGGDQVVALPDAAPMGSEDLVPLPPLVALGKRRQSEIEDVPDGDEEAPPTGKRQRL